MTLYLFFADENFIKDLLKDKILATKVLLKLSYIHVNSKYYPLSHNCMFDESFKNSIADKKLRGFSKDKDEKKWFVENRWIPAVNSLKGKYDYPEWHFIEIANDIRDIKNQLIEKIINL